MAPNSDLFPNRFPILVWVCPYWVLINLTQELHTLEIHKVVGQHGTTVPQVLE